MALRIDVVIPSFRLDERYLLPILTLDEPEGFDVQYYLIADNPAVRIPASVRSLLDAGRIHLLVNERNYGFSATRNRGIDAGIGSWILLLDDDIIPSSDLLLCYAEAIARHPHSIGFIGVTSFPEPESLVGQALVLNGSLGHFQKALEAATLPWAPTANVMLNRHALGARRFNEGLKMGGEDIAFMAGNALAHKQQYICVPRAIVTHPWWDGERMQLKRLFRYGLGTGELMKMPEFRPYTFIDFTNTIESVSLLLLSVLAVVFSPLPMFRLFLLALGLLFSEFLTTVLRLRAAAKPFALSLVVQMMVHKNAYEAGMFYGVLRDLRFGDFSRRIDLGFRKPNPSPFRLNKWKIVKMVLFGFILLLVLLFVP